MMIIPAIDLLDGQVVRLKQGDYNNKTVYSDNPAEQAQKFAKKGASFLHIVDLNGARDGNMKNMEDVLKIRERIDIPIQVGGGIRVLDDIDNLLACGINRIVMSTAVLEDTKFLQDAIKKYGADKIVVSLDVKEGVVKIKGWEHGLKKTPKEILNELKKAGVSFVVYTDVLKDGMKNSPNFESIKKIHDYGFNVIASGGVSCTDDIKKLEAMNIYGCIIGRALYEDKNLISTYAN